MIIMAPASGTPALAIARLVAADEDTVRDIVHAFRTHGIRYFHGCYSLGDDQLWASPGAARAAIAPCPR